MTKRGIYFEVDESVADEMRHRSVYLDVFGWVRWTDTAEAVAGASMWRDVTAALRRPVYPERSQGDFDIATGRGIGAHE